MNVATYARVSTQHREKKHKLWRYCKAGGLQLRVRVAIVMVLLSTLPPWSGYAQSGSLPTYFYGPEPSSLTGVIKTITFPGPPNYEDTKAGDSPEPSLIFVLDQPISVLPKEGTKEYLDDPYRDVRRIQLVIYSDRKLKVIEGKHVRLTGTFFSRHTGHHHADVLMEVTRIEKVK